MRSCFVALICTMALAASAESPALVKAKETKSISVDTVRVEGSTMKAESSLEQLTNTDQQPKKTWSKIKDLFL
ncbi:MAG: hypothetical protein GF344_08835 [Chitinivibrionales bacterium]|nr:hypothetical protein [Chitinivibrionales bacterium]MBD3356963.1 hypothetical protein [Chitinivibrionales bacterium]